MRAARQALEFAQQGATDYNEAGARRVSGLFNAATSGRTVTFVLQNMRGHVEGFDDWYAGVEADLKADPVATWFKNLRNNIEKRGDPGAISNSTHIHHLSTGMLNQAAPVGTVSTVIGDQWGRNYWTIRLADGTEDKVYFTMPGNVTNTITLEDAPGQRDVGDLLAQYMDTLSRIVTEAEGRFS